MLIFLTEMGFDGMMKKIKDSVIEMLLHTEITVRWKTMNEKDMEITTMEDLVQRMLEVSADSAVYQKIAFYVENHHMELIFMTAGELAGKLSVSQASVSKFFIALGYKGYADFLRSLQKMVGKEITAPQRYFYTSNSSHHTDDVVEKEVENLRLLKELVQEESYARVTEMLACKKNIVLLSARMSATLLPHMKYTLDKLRDGVEIVTPGRENWDYLQFNKKKEDTLIFVIAFPRYPQILVNKAKELKEAGFALAVITDSRFSPLCRYSSEQLLVPTTVSSIFDLYSTPMALINLLVTDVSRKIPGVQERLDKIEKLDAIQHNYYGKTTNL